jgi:hypothetical protein
MSESAFDILGGDAGVESVIDDLPSAFGNPDQDIEIGPQDTGDIDSVVDDLPVLGEHDEDAADILGDVEEDAEALGDAPGDEFGTHEDFGTSPDNEDGDADIDDGVIATEDGDLEEDIDLFADDDSETDEADVLVDDLDVDYDAAYDLPGTTQINGDVPSDLQFDMAMAANNEIVGDSLRGRGFDEEMQRRFAGDNPLLAHRRPELKVRDWPLDFGPVWAPAGKRTVITVSPQCLFRGEKIIATDTGSPAGTGTRILQVTIGPVVQRPSTDRGSLTSFFAATVLGNGIKFDTVQAAYQIRVTVSFVQTCTFDMSVFGTAVLP